ncbi:MAG: sigma-70 family RNA polymerase sigma factor [Labilithrix sp.]|nr:sigma-70 family RNA polymerase sigma factor [Labilithrix sp.]
MLVPPAVERRSIPDFRPVFREHFRFVCLTLRRLGVRDGDVEDVAQDVFVTVHRKLDTYDPSRPLRVWLFGFCLRAAAAHRRLARHRLQVQEETAPETAADGPLPDAELAADQDRRLVLAALDAIDPHRRPVFVMYDLEEFTVAEIAEALSIPVNTVYSRLRVAREEFREQVARLRARSSR